MPTYNINRLTNRDENTTFRTTYLPEPLDLFASTRVVSVDGATLPVVNVNLLHATQHQLPAHRHTWSQRTARVLNLVQYIQAMLNAATVSDFNKLTMQVDRQYATLLLQIDELTIKLNVLEFQ